MRIGTETADMAWNTPAEVEEPPYEGTNASDLIREVGHVQHYLGRDGDDVF